MEKAALLDCSEYQPDDLQRDCELEVLKRVKKNRQDAQRDDAESATREPAPQGAYTWSLRSFSAAQRANHQ